MYLSGYFLHKAQRLVHVVEADFEERCRPKDTEPLLAICTVLAVVFYKFAVTKISSISLPSIV